MVIGPEFIVLELSMLKERCVDCVFPVSTGPSTVMPVVEPFRLIVAVPVPKLYPFTLMPVSPRKKLYQPCNERLVVKSGVLRSKPVM